MRRWGESTEALRFTAAHRTAERWVPTYVTEQDDSATMIVDVGPVAHGGHCVARADGRVIFVRHALPGERVRIAVTQRNSKFWRADAVEVLRAGEDRVTPPCRFAGTCGGCDFQHVSAEGQLRLKSDVLREQLVRLGGMNAEDVSRFGVEPLPGGLLGWRTRMQYAVDRDGKPGLRPHRSKEVIDIDDCPIASDSIRDSDVLQEHWPGASNVCVTQSGTGQLSVYTQSRRHKQPRMVSGPRKVEERNDGHTFELSCDSFWQVHPEAARALTATVREMAQVKSGETVWDLYSGAGLFAAALADSVGSGGHVAAVESAPTSRLRRNLAKLPTAKAHVADVEDVVTQLPTPDVVVVDPPRKGLGSNVVKAIVDGRPRAVVYVACDPAALARDVSLFTDLGYRVETVRAFDAFPMTQHFESVALLT